jgi:hypothetical protein
MRNKLRQQIILNAMLQAREARSDYTRLKELGATMPQDSRVNRKYHQACRVIDRLFP